MNSDLTSKKCIPCKIGTPPLPKEKAEELLQQIPNWEIEENYIERKFKFKDFKAAMGFVNKVADLAEEEGHHPDIYIFYNKVDIKLTTHAAKGLTENDFILAAKIDRLLS